MSSGKGIGERYQEETCYSRLGMAAALFGRFRRAEPFKQYPECPAVPLPEIQALPKADFWTAVANRRSVREFSDKPLKLEVLALLVHATQGITGRRGKFLFRSAPSAGALYPIETYVCVNRVDGLASGMYHLNVAGRTLECICPGGNGGSLAKACLGQGFVEDCAAVFIWTAIPGRSKWKYRERAYRYMYMDAGHIAENLYLAAVSLGLGCCTVGAFYDADVNSLLGLDGIQETALYLGAVGPVA